MQVPDRRLGLYLHVPFCTVRCSYCDFYLLPDGARGADAAGRDAFVEALLGEIDAAAERSPGAAADTAHFGGGTPSLLEPRRIARILEALTRRFALPAGSEIALEANPEDLTPERCAALRDAGIGRLAIGVQAMEDAVLRRLLRPHDARTAREALRAARAAGFASVAADLILGLPGQGSARAIDGVREMVDLGVDHVSLYLLELHERTRLGREVALGRAIPPPQDETADLWESAVDLLADRGFAQYEISNFARPGHESRHNMKYWTDAEYLGFGPSAHSYIGGARFSNPPDLAGYIAARGRPEPRREPESPGARAREALYASLRLVEGVDLQALRRRHGALELEAGDPRLRELEQAGLVTLRGTRLALTRRGRLVSNEVLERLA